MANKKKRDRSPERPAARPSAPRPQKRSGPSQRDLQRAAQQKAHRKATVRRAGLMTGVTLVVGAVVGGAFVLDRRGDADLRAVLTAGSCEADTRSDPTGPAGQNHVAAPSYQVIPPAGGDHLASAARAGSYEGDSVPQDGMLVHSLEHGYVVAWHGPDLPQDQREQLQAFQRAHGDDVIVVERAGLPVPVAATAWGQRLLCQEVEAEPLERFFDEHVGNGPEDVPRG